MSRFSYYFQLWREFKNSNFQTIMFVFIIVEMPQGLLALNPYTSDLSRAMGERYSNIRTDTVLQHHPSDC